MLTTEQTVPTGDMAAYIATARQRHHQEQLAQKQRYQLAWQLANQANHLLHEQFAVSKVMLFGSLLQPHLFHQWSDIDLAAWGLTDQNWLRVMSAVRQLSDEIEINLVDVTCCSPALLQAIEKTGQIITQETVINTDDE